MEIQCVEGDGNCLPTSVIKTLDFDKDPGSDQMYTQIYLCRVVIMHLISMWGNFRCGYHLEHQIFLWPPRFGSRRSQDKEIHW